MTPASVLVIIVACCLCWAVGLVTGLGVRSAKRQKKDKLLVEVFDEVLVEIFDGQ